MEPETEIVSDAPIGRLKHKAAKKATVPESAHPAVVVGTDGEPVVRRQPDEEKEPIEGESVKLKVLRVCPNPRLIWCVYQDDGLERRVLVRVGRNKNFTPRMELQAVRGARASEPWLYQGRLPRLRGRW
jgi:hypothetical protein